MATSTIDSRVSSATTAVGLVVTGLVVGTWLAAHVCAIFLVDWTTRWLWIAAPVVVALQCWLNVGLFIVAHDTMHSSLAPQHLWLNRTIGCFCVFIYAGFSYNKLYENHHAHHRTAGTADDPDFDIDDCPHVISLLTRFHFGDHYENHDAPWVPWWKLPAQRRSTINPEYPEVENG